MKIIFKSILLSFILLSLAHAKDDRDKLLDYMVSHYNDLQDKDVKDFITFCPLMQNTSGDNEAYCKYMYNKKKGVLSSLSSLLGKVRNETVSEERALGVMSCLPETAPGMGDLEDILKRLDGKSDCSPMSAGDFKLSKFLLQKKDDNSFEALVNINFEQEDGSSSPEEMKEKINKCLAGFTPYLRSPSGETLAVKVLSPAEVESSLPIGMRPNPETVKIRHSKVKLDDGSEINFRADAANYPDSIPCETIVHETLHHLGLCDEYQENSPSIIPSLNKSFKDAFSCRTVPKSNTIMGQNVAAVRDQIPRKFNCQCKTEACRKALVDTSPDRERFQAYASLGNTWSAIPYAVMKKCQNQYLDPRIYPDKEPLKRHLLIKQDEYSLTFETRFFYEDGANLRLNRQLMVCKCEGDDECSKAMPDALKALERNPSVTECPASMDSLPTEEFAAGPQDKTSVEGDVLKLVTIPASSESLLSPNHFNRILYGDCETGPVSHYNKCASYAYKGTGDAECSSKPASCANDSYFLNGSAQ